MLDRDNVHALATGTLTTFDSQIDVTTGTIKMRSTFDNPNGVLFPEQFVNVRLLVDTMTGVTLAPNPAIQLGASGNFVYLLNDDATVSKRDVAIGPTDGKHTVITSGLKAGDKVVIDGVDRLRDGAKVKVVDIRRGRAGGAERVRGPAATAPGRGPPKNGGTGSIIGIATTSRAPRGFCPARSSDQSGGCDRRSWSRASAGRHVFDRPDARQPDAIRRRDAAPSVGRSAGARLSEMTLKAFEAGR